MYKIHKYLDKHYYDKVLGTVNTGSIVMCDCGRLKFHYTGGDEADLVDSWQYRITGKVNGVTWKFPSKQIVSIITRHFKLIGRWRKK